MNKCMFTGNLGQDPKVRTTQSGTKVCQLSLAVDRPFRDKEGNKVTSFLDIVAWGKTAEACERYLVKGSRIGVESYAEKRSYDAQDGSKRWITEFVVERFDFLDSKKSVAYEPAPATEPNAPSGFVETDDELPF